MCSSTCSGIYDSTSKPRTAITASCIHRLCQVRRVNHVNCCGAFAVPTINLAHCRHGVVGRLRIDVDGLAVVVENGEGKCVGKHLSPPFLLGLNNFKRIDALCNTHEVDVSA